MSEASETVSERIEVERFIPAEPSVIFDIVRDPFGHVAIDASGMLQDATGEPAGAVGDTFVIHMDRESLGDFDMGKYDVTVTITALRAGPVHHLGGLGRELPEHRPLLRLPARAGRRWDDR